jgi:hypothetical protein
VDMPVGVTLHHWSPFCRFSFFPFHLEGSFRTPTTGTPSSPDKEKVIACHMITLMMVLVTASRVCFALPAPAHGISTNTLVHECFPNRTRQALPRGKEGGIS